MAGNLLNELIREILFPGFHVPNEMLHDVSDISPFFRPSYQPCSLTLLVCKRWAAVGTPLLYHVVVLRSKAQARTLERTLRKNKELGALIRKLRVEGGYGAAMRTIITSSPHILDLTLSLDIRSSDSVKGLLSSLSTINPSWLTILDPRDNDAKDNQPLRQVTEKLTACLKAWSKLREISLPSDIYRYPLPIIIDALYCAPNLQVIVIPEQAVLKSSHSFKRLAKKPSLKNIWLALPKQDVSPALVTRLEKWCDRIHPHGLVALRPSFKIKGAMVSQPSNPLYVPLENVSKDISDSIWDRILHFAIDTDPRPHRFSGGGGNFKKFNFYHTCISMVSKTFRRLAIPHINRVLYVYRGKDLRLYAKTLKSDPSKGPQLQTIRFLPNSHPKMRPIVEGYLDMVLSQASCLISIGSFHRLSPAVCIPMLWSSFEKLAHVTGPNMVYLLDITIPATRAIESPAVLSRFSALRKLSCSIAINFHTEGQTSPDWLPSLEVLRLWDCHSSFFNLLSMLNLPALRELEILGCAQTFRTVTKFLQVHGSKILTFMVEQHVLRVFDLCPNMSLLSIKKSQVWYYDNIYIPRAKEKHMHVSKIIISGGVPSFGVFSSTDYSSFPALQEIQIRAIKEWPSTEYMISKSPYPAYSEAVAVHGISLTNVYGVSWRPRLQYP